MIKKNLSIGLILLFLITGIQLNAQKYSGTRSWKTSLYIGASSFHGDISDGTKGFAKSNPFSKYFYKDRRFGCGFYLDKMFTPQFGIRGNFMYSQMKSTSEEELLYFKGDMFEYSVSWMIDMTNLLLGSSNYRKWSAYCFLGVGISETSSTLYTLYTDEFVGSVGSHMSPTGTGKQRMTEPVFPMGVGFDYKFSNKHHVFLEFTRHVVSTDRLDAYPVSETSFESLGLLNVGMSIEFNMPNHWAKNKYVRYNGKSSDKAIRNFNKNKRVVMKTKANKKAMKRKRKKYTRKRNRRRR